MITYFKCTFESSELVIFGDSGDSVELDDSGESCKLGDSSNSQESSDFGDSGLSGDSNKADNSGESDKAGAEWYLYIQIFEYIGHKYLFGHSFAPAFLTQIYSDTC